MWVAQHLNVSLHPIPGVLNFQYRKILNYKLFFGFYFAVFYFLCFNLNPTMIGQNGHFWFFDFVYLPKSSILKPSIMDFIFYILKSIKNSCFILRIKKIHKHLPPKKGFFKKTVFLLKHHGRMKVNCTVFLVISPMA